jgi:hypothetical protein
VSRDLSKDTGTLGAAARVSGRVGYRKIGVTAK